MTHAAEYVRNHSTPPDEVLQWLERQTHIRAIHPRMLSGPIQGRFLEMISAMLAPGRILEIGTFTGYSALCLAKGLGMDGVLHTIECNDEYEELIREAISRSGRQEQIVLHIGDALSLIPKMDELFDLVYIDGDKSEYIAYYEAVMPKVRPGGIIMVDNVLWGGKVLEEPLPTDARTREMAAFNAKVQADPRVENVLLPFRDGLMMIRKKAS
ncbi:MAG: O-methyltransferase [Bacteroidetes bacterium]|nr:O-methyltransferase [Bacteroidota bacterium]